MMVGLQMREEEEVLIWKQSAEEEVPELLELMAEVVGVQTVCAMWVEAEAYPVLEVEEVRGEAAHLGPW